MIKKLWLIPSMVVITIVIFNHKIITNPNEALFETIASKNHLSWRVDLLLWRGADPYYKNGLSYEAMLMFKHYNLIERFGALIPDGATEEMYQLSKKYVTSEEIDKRIRKSLRIKSN